MIDTFYIIETLKFWGNFHDVFVCFPFKSQNQVKLYVIVLSNSIIAGNYINCFYLFYKCSFNNIITSFNVLHKCLIILKFTSSDFALQIQCKLKLVFQLGNFKSNNSYW